MAHARSSQPLVLKLSVMALACLALAAARPARAVDTTWLGGSGLWQTNEAWSAGAVPDGSDVNVFIDGSTLTSSSVLLQGGVAVGNVFIGAGDALSLGNTVLSTYGGSVVNHGTLSLTSAAPSSRWRLGADTALSGGGATLLVNGGNNFVYGLTGTETLTIAAAHTLRGRGNLGFLNFGALNVRNQGLIVAEGTGLAAYTGSFNNTAGLVQVADASSFTLTKGTLSGGTVQSMGSAVLTGEGSFSSITLQGNFQLRDGLYHDVTLTGTNHLGNLHGIRTSGTLTNSGTLTLGTAGTATSLALVGDTLLAGSGQTVIGNDNTNRIYGSNSISSATKTLTIAAGHTLRGGGQVGVVNLGAINVVNQGTVLAEAAGGMSAYVSSFDNTAGTLQVADGRTFTLANGTLHGGTVQGAGSARIRGAGIFQDITIAGQISVGENEILNTSGTLTNNGILTLVSAGNSARWNLAGDTLLAGSGQTLLGTERDNNISSITGKTLTIAEGHTVQGSGRFGRISSDALHVVNQGTVRAEGAVGIRANVLGFDNSAGTLQIADGSAFILDRGMLSGGVVQGYGTGVVDGDGTFSGVLLQGGLQLRGGLYRNATLAGTNAVSSMATAGTFTNNGSLTMGSTNTTTRWELAEDTTLTGTGQTLIGNDNTNAVYSASRDKTLTIAAGHTLRGGGDLGHNNLGTIKILNQGTLVADASGGMTIRTAGADGFVNQGRMEVAAGTQMTALNQTLTQNTSHASLQVDGVLRLSLLDMGAGSLSGTGTILGNVQTSGGTVQAGNSPGKLSIDGDLVLGDGTRLVVEITGPLRGTQYDWLAVTGDVVLDGDLLLAFTGYQAQVGDTFAFLTSQGGTISGAFDNVYVSGYAMDVQYATRGVSVTVTGVTPVPEPTTWAMLVAGLLAVATVARRRAAKR